MYIAFFGKSQDFTTAFFDRTHPIEDFNSVIKDFDLLESKVFTVDDIQNKEILSRTYFTSQGRSYCLLKLYSFAQAYSGTRVAGSIYGVGLLAQQNIDITKANLDLLRAAKTNFAKLSLEGAKFNKSNFEDDATRIWKAIVSSNEGNLLDKVSVSNLKVNGSGAPVSFYVKDLFLDVIKLNDRISSQDTVYFSEDLEHLKRTQNRWGKDNFPIYVEQNNQYVLYKEPVVVQATATSNPKDTPTNQGGSDLVKLRSELADSQYNNRQLEQSLLQAQKKQRLQVYVISGLIGLLVLLAVYLLFFTGPTKEVPKKLSDTVQAVSVDNTARVSSFLGDPVSLDSCIDFLNNVKYIYTFENKRQAGDSTKFSKKYHRLEEQANKYNIPISAVKEVYERKFNELMRSPTIDQKTGKSVRKP